MRRLGWFAHSCLYPEAASFFGKWNPFVSWLLAFPRTVTYWKWNTLSWLLWKGGWCRWIVCGAAGTYYVNMMWISCKSSICIKNKERLIRNKIDVEIEHFVTLLYKERAVEMRSIFTASGQGANLIRWITGTQLEISHLCHWRAI